MLKKIEELFHRMNYDFFEDREDGIEDFYELFCKFYDKINVEF